MFYQAFLKIKNLKEKLIRKFEEHQNIKNQEISIRDIFVYTSDPTASFGESRNHNNQYLENPDLERLVDHIESLAEIANAYHEKYFCEKDDDGISVIKEDSLNKITRLSLNEFSLYGATPLSMSELALLVELIDEIAKNQQSNVHLLLSSISVMTDDEQTLNVSFYVQCGEEPKVEVFCKGKASTIDVTYGDSSNFMQQKGRGNGNISGFVSSLTNDRVTISNNTVFQIETKGGAQYTQAVDICLDHACKHSKKLLENICDREDVDTNIIPNQIDHILTSNSIKIDEKARVSKSIIQIDPRFTRKDVFGWANDIVSPLDLENSIKKNKYSETSIQNTSRGFSVKNPPFGSDYEVVAQKERKLSGFSNGLKPIIDTYNEKVKKQVIDSPLRLVNHDVAQYDAIINQYTDSAKQLNDLYDSLLSSIKFGFLESLFKTQSYRVKSEARNVIKDSLLTFQELNQRPEALTHQTHVLLKDLKFQLEHVDHGIPHKLITNLNSKVEEIQTSVPSTPFQFGG